MTDTFKAIYNYNGKFVEISIIFFKNGKNLNNDLKERVYSLLKKEAEDKTYKISLYLNNTIIGIYNLDDNEGYEFIWPSNDKIIRIYKTDSLDLAEKYLEKYPSTLNQQNNCFDSDKDEDSVTEKGYVIYLEEDKINQEYIYFLDKCFDNKTIIEGICEENILERKKYTCLQTCFEDLEKGAHCD